MKFLTTIAILAATALANPMANPNPEAAAATTEATTTAATTARKEFHLKTTGAKNAKHNDLFLYGYHTGAGLNDAVLDKDGTYASPFYLNGTRALADYHTDFPWGMIANGDANYASWEAIEINAGGGTHGFSINPEGNFVWSHADGFGGWLVCDWWHNAPQLFYLNRYYNPAIPSSCSRVQLKPIYLK